MLSAPTATASSASTTTNTTTSFPTYAPAFDHNVNSNHHNINSTTTRCILNSISMPVTN